MKYTEKSNHPDIEVLHHYHNEYHYNINWSPIKEVDYHGH
jgi:hypothetical protein